MLLCDVSGWWKFVYELYKVCLFNNMQLRIWHTSMRFVLGKLCLSAFAFGYKSLVVAASLGFDSDYH